MRDRLGLLRFKLLNITFVAPSQLLLMWLFTSPVHQAWAWRDQPLGWLDGFSVLLFLGFLSGQVIGDGQMWTFQQDKQRRIAAGEEVVQPIIVTGLFRYSRHPSYLCEIGMWFAFCLFAVSASGQWFHWTGLGVVLLVAQFISVIRLTEEISAEKYPTYGEYQARTPMLVPLPGLRRQGPPVLELPHPTRLYLSTQVPSPGLFRVASEVMLEGSCGSSPPLQWPLASAQGSYRPTGRPISRRTALSCRPRKNCRWPDQFTCAA